MPENPPEKMDETEEVKETHPKNRKSFNLLKILRLFDGDFGACNFGGLFRP